MNIIDIHPHIISDDEKRYPPAPLFGKRSDWSKESPTTAESLIANGLVRARPARRRPPAPV